jgi:NADH:ubiquinone oxidoreductase subunit 6 (subunit J)
MIQIVGLIVAVYAVARLLQVPIEHSTASNRQQLLWLLTVGGVLAIGLLTLMLLSAGVDPSSFPR